MVFLSTVFLLVFSFSFTLNVVFILHVVRLFVFFFVFCLFLFCLFVRSVCLFFIQDPAVAVAFEKDGEAMSMPPTDPLMDQIFPLAEACIADLGPEVCLRR